ncbi:MAG: hypothetical protein ACRDG9_03615 [Actinomycetota bacterium]
MSGDGDLKLDKDSLALIEKGLKSAIGELKESGADATGSKQGSGFEQLTLSKMEAGDGGLADDFEGFCERWEWGVRALVQDANALAARLNLAAGMLYEEDQYRAGTFKVGANALFGNPHATEEEVAKMDYSEIAAQNMPDFSAKSFEDARTEMGQTWKDTGRALSTEGMGGAQNEFLMDQAGFTEEQRQQAIDDTFGPSPEERAKQQQADGGEG